jgi:uncharacterized protein (DUF1778 family)
MPKTVTLRLNDKKYQLFKKFAEIENRPLSNFIETATNHFIENQLDVDEFEMLEIENNKDLQESLIKGVADAKEGKGKFV